MADLPIPLPDDCLNQVAGLISQDGPGERTLSLPIASYLLPIEELPDMVEARGMCEARKARCLVHEGEMPTLQAWTYASTGGALEFLQRKWSGRLGDVLKPDGVFNGPRFARVPCQAPHGVDFLSQRHVFLIRPVSRRIVHPGFSDHLFLFQKEACWWEAMGHWAKEKSSARCFTFMGGWLVRHLRARNEITFRTRCPSCP